jgi:hypothetical protein
VLISGPYTDNSDTLQFAAVYKLDGSNGAILWSAIDSGIYVNDGVLKTDYSNNVYLGATKSNSSASQYSQLSFTKFLSADGSPVWNRSFDNSENNFYLDMQANNAGDLFFAATTIIGSDGNWFAGRVGNAAGDVQSTGIDVVANNESGMDVFPNPFSSSANVVFETATNENAVLKIFDLQGRLVSEQATQITKGRNVITVSLQLAAGMYIFRLESKSRLYTKRVLAY